MSVLTNKRVVIVGGGDDQIADLKTELESHGVSVDEYDCSEISEEKAKSIKADLIVFNHLHSDQMCDGALNIFTKDSLATPLPVFTVVNDNPEDIQDALARGAADYIVPNETTSSVMQKIEAIFNEGNIFSGGSSIDITPIEADIKTTGIKVFVVEDDPLLRNLLSIRLEKSFFPFQFSSDGNNVLPTVKQFMPDVIILDLMLPGKNGFEVLAELKMDNSISHIPVIVFSNRDGSDDRKRAKELGAAGFYVKAMTDLSELVETIESLVKK